MFLRDLLKNLAQQPTPRRSRSRTAALHRAQGLAKIHRVQGYWEHLQMLVESGQPFAAVTLVDVIASAPANAGSKMLVTGDGLFFGTVGGGKIELKALAEAKSLAL